MVKRASEDMYMARHSIYIVYMGVSHEKCERRGVIVAELG